MAAKDLVEYVAKSLVDDPDAVKVDVIEEDGATVIEPTSPTTTWASRWSEWERREGAAHAAQGDRGPRRRAGPARDRLSERPFVAEEEAARGTAGGGRGASSTQRLVVALVRGVHGLRGAVRVEVLTDRPEQRFRPGAVLYRELSDTPLTIASAEAVADGPGWRVRFEEVTTRDAANGLRGAYLESVVHPVGELARGECIGTRSWVPPSGASMAPTSARSRTCTASARTRSTSSAASRTARSTCQRSARSSACSRRDAARSSSMRRRSTSNRRSVVRLKERPKAPRRRSRRPRAAGGRVGAATLEIDVLTLFPRWSRRRSPRASRVASRSGVSPPCGCATYASSGWDGIGRSTTRPTGGGAGMVMRVELVVAAIEAVKRPESLVILMDPGGEVFGQARAVDLAGRQHLVFVCALRGRRRADPHVRRLGAVDRRLRRHRWRAAGVGGNRRRDAIAAAHRRAVDRRGVVQRRSAGHSGSTTPPSSGA